MSLDAALAWVACGQFLLAASCLDGKELEPIEGRKVTNSPKYLSRVMPKIQSRA